MASDVEMSLEEIIKKKKVPLRSGGNTRPFNKGNQRQKVAQQPTRAPPVADARNKLIVKRRAQVADLRDKLAHLSKKQDVRLKLERLRLRKSPFNVAMGRNIAYNNIQENRKQMRNMATNINRGFIDLTRQVSSRPLPLPPTFNVSRQIGYTKSAGSTIHSSRLQTAYRSPPKRILRTVENDSYLAAPIVLDDDYEPRSPPRASPARLPAAVPPPPARLAGLNLKIVAHNHTGRHSADGTARKSSELREERPLTSILKKRPMASMRMDRMERVERRRASPPPAPASPPPAAPEYRIVVSNLRSSVTGTDIQELFGDVGGLVESRLVRPGTAEVIYRSLEDAQRAVDLYHNRQLDGQPMNCLLVNPRAPSVATSGRLGASTKPSLPASGASSVVPDIDTFHKVLFSRH